MRFPTLLLAALLLAQLVTPTFAQGPSADGRPVEDLPIAVLLATVRAEGGLSTVHVWLEIPGHALPELPALDIEAEAVDAEGAVRATSGWLFDLGDEEAERARASSVKIHGSFVLEPGFYGLRLRVASEGKDPKPRPLLPFEVASYESEHAALLPPFFIDDYGEAPVIRRDLPEGAVDPFVTAAGEPFTPDVVPVLEEGPGRSRITIVGYRLTGDNSLLDAALFSADGSLLGKDRLGLVHKSETTADGLDRLDFSLQTEGLPPGEYQLEVSIQDLAHGRTDQTLMPFRIQ